MLPGGRLASIKRKLSWFRHEILTNQKSNPNQDISIGGGEIPDTQTESDPKIHGSIRDKILRGSNKGSKDGESSESTERISEQDIDEMNTSERGPESRETRAKPRNIIGATSKKNHVQVEAKKSKPNQKSENPPHKCRLHPEVTQRRCALHSSSSESDVLVNSCPQHPIQIPKTEARSTEIKRLLRTGGSSSECSQHQIKPKYHRPITIRHDINPLNNGLDRYQTDMYAQTGQDMLGEVNRHLVSAQLWQPQRADFCDVYRRQTNGKALKFIAQIYFLIHLSVIIALIIHYRIISSQGRRSSSTKNSDEGAFSIRDRRTVDHDIGLGKPQTVEQLPSPVKLDNFSYSVNRLSSLSTSNDILVNLMGYNQARRILQYLAVYLLASSCILLLLIRLTRFFVDHQVHVGPNQSNYMCFYDNKYQDSQNFQYRIGLDCTAALVGSIILGLSQLVMIGLNVANNIDWLSEQTRWPIYLSALHFCFVSLLMQYVLGRVTSKHKLNKLFSAIERNFDNESAVLNGKAEPSRRKFLATSINNATDPSNRVEIHFNNRIGNKSITNLSNQPILAHPQNPGQSLASSSFGNGLHSIALSHLLVTHLFLWFIEMNSIDLLQLHHAISSTQTSYGLNHQNQNGVTNDTSTVSYSNDSTLLATDSIRPSIASNATRTHNIQLDMQPLNDNNQARFANGTQNQSAPIDGSVTGLIPEEPIELKTLVRRKTPPGIVPTTIGGIQPMTTTTTTSTTTTTPEPTPSMAIESTTRRESEELSQKQTTQRPDKAEWENTGSAMSEGPREAEDTGELEDNDIDLRSVLPARKRHLKSDRSQIEERPPMVSQKRYETQITKSRPEQNVMKRKTAFKTITNTPFISKSFDSMLQIKPAPIASLSIPNSRAELRGRKSKQQEETVTPRPFPSVDTISDMPVTPSSGSSLPQSTERTDLRTTSSPSEQFVPGPSFSPSEEQTELTTAGPENVEEQGASNKSDDSEHDQEPDLDSLLPPVPNYNDSSDSGDPSNEGMPEPSGDEDEQLSQFHQPDNLRLKPKSSPLMMKSESSKNSRNITDDLQRRISYHEDGLENRAHQPGFVSYLMIIVGQYHILLAAVLLNLWLEKTSSTTEGVVGTKQETSRPRLGATKTTGHKLRSRATRSRSIEYLRDGQEPGRARCSTSISSSSSEGLVRVSSVDRLLWLSGRRSSIGESESDSIPIDRDFSSSSDDMLYLHSGRQRLIGERAKRQGHLTACSLFLGLCVTVGSFATIMFGNELLSILAQSIIQMSSFFACLVGLYMIWQAQKRIETLKSLRTFRNCYGRQRILTDKRLWQHKSSIYLDPEYLGPSRFERDLNKTRGSRGRRARKRQQAKTNSGQQFFHYLFLLAAYYSGASIALNLGGQFTVQQLFPPEVVRFISSLQARHQISSLDQDILDREASMFSISDLHLIFHSVLAIKGLLLILQVTIQTILIRSSYGQPASSKLKQIFTFLMISNLSLWAIEIRFDRQHDNLVKGHDIMTNRMDMRVQCDEIPERLILFEGFTSFSGSIVTISHLYHGLIFV